MRSRRRSFTIAAVFLAGVIPAAILGSRPAQASRPGLAELGPSFLMVENMGQFDPRVRFQVRVADRTLWVTDTSLWITQFEAVPGAAGGVTQPARGRPGAGPTREPRRGVNLELTFPGRRGAVALVATNPRPSRMNYFLGSDASRWRSGVRTYGRVTWRGLYPGISLTLTETGAEPALVVDAAPGADPASLRLRVVGAERVHVMRDGGLVADTAIGPVLLPAIVVDGRPLEAEADGTDVVFTGAGKSAPRSAPSVDGAAIGSGLEYGTFLGGGGDDFAVALARDPDSSNYVAGFTYSPEFPTTPGAFDITYEGGDAFVSKLAPSGSTLVYSTFLGGRGADSASGLALGPDGAAYVAGTTGSADFPTTSWAFDTTYAGGDSFVTKVDPSGGDLVYSTFLGGTANDSIEDLALAPDGSTYLTGWTLSADFPTTPGAFNRTINQGGTGLYKDAFATALNPTGTDLLYSTFLGGTFNDYGYGVTVGPEDTAYVTGPTSSLDFPTTAGAFDRTFSGGSRDAFVTNVTPDGSALAFSTYLGGFESDTGTALTLDQDGNVYVAGFTSSPDYPTTPGAYDPTINSSIFSDVLATKLNPTGSALVYSTFLGGEEGERADDVVLDPDGSLTLTGNTYSANFPTTPKAFDRTLGGQADAFVSRFDPTGSALLYGSFIGGTGRLTIDQGLALAPSEPGAVSIAGETSSGDFPVTPGAFDTTYNGEADAFVATLRIAPTVHVDRIEPFYRPVGSGYVVGAAVRILSAGGSPVEGADVTVEVAYPDGTEVLVTRTTGSRGVAVVVVPASDSGTYTFTVIDVARPGAVYDPSQNVETTDFVTIP